MASSSTEELCEESTWILYKDREEWKDVTPVPQDDGPNTVVSILYTDKFKDVYDYFRAVLKSNEKSERALELTKDALDLNPANYTVWQYRREILKHLDKDLYEELNYVKQVAEDNPKNYQVWHHRGVIVNWLQEPSQELQVTRMSLNQDAKNYHAWQHRQWVLHKFNLFDNELAYVDTLLEEDIRNNSAWNHRYFVINNTTGFTKDILDREIAYSLDKIKKVTCNESSWNYLRGLLIHHEKGLSRNERVIEFCEELYTSGIRSPYLLGFLVDIYGSMEKGDGDKPHTFQKALEICDALAKEYDTIRREYWNFIARNIAQQMNTSNGEELLGVSAPSELVMEAA
uniref:Protein farnesyltransferase/geranylgeranyltransferase type-1 subunit alpha n=1 Tax=Timema monikensis TaxID=170555 RepID=A0A7R9EFZ3_9NEOP|nr:unnamed protein product [Timema monikensis]